MQMRSRKKRLKWTSSRTLVQGAFTQSQRKEECQTQEMWQGGCSKTAKSNSGWNYQDMPSISTRQDRGLWFSAHSGHSHKMTAKSQQLEFCQQSVMKSWKTRISGRTQIIWVLWRFDSCPYRYPSALVEVWWVKLCDPQQRGSAAVSCTVSTLEADCVKPVHSCCCRGHCDARTRNSVKLTSETWVKK